MDGEKHKIDTSFLTRLDRYTLLLKKRVAAVHSGSHISNMKGTGIELVDHRKYNQGDSLKDIDWNLYARTERLYIRRYEEDKTLNMVILLDASSSMVFPGTTPTKYEYGATIALGVSYIVMKYNDRYLISTFTDDVDYARARKGRNEFLRTIDSLSRIPVSGETKLADCADSVYPRIKTKSMVLIISDFLDDLDSIRYAVRRLSRHELVLVQLYEETEIDLPETLDGATKFIDSETGKELNIVVGPQFKKEYAAEYGRHVAGLEKIAYDFQIPYFRVNIKNQPFDTVLRIIGER
ncbi:Cell division protein DivIC (FtsB), stabilizes FtsL against RasP cleavage [Methanosarcina sp. MTP4]|uniref:DUF58 domain-containing protein n=1 Tax=Methanosarcina sp. MTP4 TaxID=1434100 RepID=UPI000615541F|nr:DUF58 domain-containing protein [Methanosarcina sp. MTP4]AKB25556.1 Cell division protein DivIC (FtsB), stabilizes FtsL against RasP cleavage [Methanosarcina sp. MTP4]